MIAPLLAIGAVCAQTPIVFVHGNGDDATKWLPVIWMFESNGYPADRLFAIRFTDPSARSDDRKPEAFHSSTTDAASELAGFVARVLLETKSAKVALVGSSRGGMTIRNYIKNAGGAAVVSHAILCGTPNHGVAAIDTNLDNEFNGKGHFLRQLNEGSEVVEGVRFMTIRSDNMDKYARPNVGFAAPELKGAENVVLEGLDHREVAFHPLAFAKTYRFITGQEPKTMTAVATPGDVEVSGLVTGFAAAAATNRPLGGLRFQVFALKPGSADREGDALADTVTEESGAWGPLRVQANREYEFVLEKDGRSVTYFMTGLLRSTTLLNFRYWPSWMETTLSEQPVTGPRVVVHRPQGYLAKGRDPILMDGAEVEGIPPGVPSRDSHLVRLPEARKAVRIQLRGEVLFVRPAERAGDISLAELIWD